MEQENELDNRWSREKARAFVSWTSGSVALIAGICALLTLIFVKS